MCLGRRENSKEHRREDQTNQESVVGHVKRHSQVFLDSPDFYFDVHHRQSKITFLKSTTQHTAQKKVKDFEFVVEETKLIEYCGRFCFSLPP